MAKKITTTLVALLALMVCSCDGPVEHDLDCATICDEAADCVGESFDEKECRQECRTDATQDQADECEQCLKDQDSCGEDTKCTLACTGVLGAVVFK